MSCAQVRAYWLSVISALSWTGLIVVALTSILAVPTVQSLADTWQKHPDYSHGWLLFAGTVFLFVKAQPWATSQSPLLGLGAVTMCAGGMLILSARVILWPLLDYAGWVLLLRGAAHSCWGREGAWRLMPVLAFGVLMFPVPIAWLNALAMFLQNVIAQLADVVLNLFWVCHRRGHQLYLAGLEEPLSVAVECSGVRQLLVFVAMAWLLAFFLHGTWWRRVALVLAAVPLAIAANVLRVLALAIMARLLGPSSIQGMFHDMPLLLTLPFGCILLLWCYHQLNKSKKLGETETAAELHHCTVVPKTGSVSLVIALLSLLILLQWMLTRHLEAADTLPPVTQFSFNELPWQLGAWQGRPHPELDKVSRLVDFADDLTMRVYSDGKGHAASVYLVFSATGQDRLHHPEICLRDARGAVELKQDRRSIPLQSEPPRLAERFRYLRQRHERTVVYYWHYTFTPPISNRQSVLQRIHLNQYENWPGITVQVQTNMTDPDAWKLLETTLLPQLDRWFSAQLPAGAQIGTGRLPVRFTHE